MFGWEGVLGMFSVPDGGALLGGLAEEEAHLLEGLGKGELGGHFWGRQLRREAESSLGKKRRMNCLGKAAFKIVDERYCCFGWSLIWVEQCFVHGLLHNFC